MSIHPLGPAHRGAPLLPRPAPLAVAVLAAATLSLGAFACGGSEESAPSASRPASESAAPGSNPAAAAGGSDAPGASAPAGGGDAQVSFVVDGEDGAQIYESNCVVCHQTTGLGLAPAFPPLDGSRWVTGDPELGIRILLHGMQGPIEVKGEPYTGVMLKYGNGLEMTDAGVAAVLTYVRNSWSNAAGPVTTDQVAAIRTATSDRRGPYTPDELEGFLR